MKKKVYICAPLGGNVEENLKRVRKYTEYALRAGVAPIVTHFYALCLNDNNPKDRELGMSTGISLLWFCDELWVFGKDVTEGMKAEIKFCKDFKIPVKKISNGDIKKILGGTINDQKENEDINHRSGGSARDYDGNARHDHACTYRLG